MKNKKSLRSSQLRSLDGMDMGGGAVVNMLMPKSATIAQTSLDKIINNSYTDFDKQLGVVIKIYYMVQDANNKTITTPLPSVPNYDDVENRRIVIKYFLNEFVQNDIITFLNLMDGLINTNWVIDTTRTPDGPFNFNIYLIYTGSYRLLNKLVDFYDNNKNILKTDLDSKM
jgi:hypothetical protein